ncbi:MAG TPA: aromatic ring-hydroxylating dioxygenase subunit alpha [Myxococcaceae bacterium]|nr:aromatic ring-hydroxylating dioxygenase subunit alpha [Myxococcaceae bacterium]
MDPSLRELLAAFEPGVPLERASSIPSTWYRDPRLEALERERVFGDTWQLVARADQLDGPGAFVTAEVAGEPLLMLRDDAGELRAFFNVCRHRAACVMTEPQGHARRLRCRYHGWTYDLQGELKGVPEFDGVEDFRREEQGLVPVAVDRWGPLVFVHLGATPPPLLGWLDPLPGRVGALDQLRFFQRKEYTLACNWKVFVDNYLDGGYHVNSVHPALGSVLQYSEYRTEVFATASLQSSPLRSADSGPLDASASATRKGDVARYGWAFPNLMVNCYAGVMDTNVVFPLGPDRCRVVIDFYFAALDGEEARAFAEQSVELGHRIQLEDVGICEDVQRGLASRSYSTGRFSVRREIAIHHFHRLLAARLRASTRGG